MKLKLLILLILLSSYKLQGQIENIKIPHINSKTLILKVFDEIETKDRIRFFYHKDWFKQVFLDTEYSGKDLKEVLNMIQSKHEIFYAFDEYKNLFFSKKKPITTKFIKGGNLEKENSKAGPIESNYSVKEKYLGVNESYSSRIVVLGKENKVSRPVTIKGKIKEEQTGQSVIGATLYVEELKQGIAADNNGNYKITLPKGNYTFRFKAIGMREIIKQVVLNDNDMLDVSFQKDFIALKEVVVKEEKFHNIRGLQIGLEQISMKELKEIPLAAGEKDILKAALMLPGVQNVGESSAGYNVRGGAVDQNLFIFNKVPIFNTSHMFGLFSSFNADIIKDFKLYKSNIPIEYGGRLSSVFDIKAKEGNKKHFSFNGGISPVTARMAIEGPLIKDRSSYVIGARSSYSNWVLNKIDYENLKESKISFYDIAANLNTDLNDKNQLSLFGYYSYDDFSLISNVQYKYQSIGASLNWKSKISKKLFSELAAIYSGYKLNVFDEEKDAYSNIYTHNLDYKEINAAFTFLPTPTNEMKFGVNSIYYEIDPGTYKPMNDASLYQKIDFENEYALESAVYLGDKFDLSQNLSVSGGIRLSIFNYLGPKTIYHYRINNPLNEGSVTGNQSYNRNDIIKTYHGLDYRLLCRYTINQFNSLKAGYNRINQYLFLLTNTISISPTDRWKLSDPFSKPLIGDQYNIGYFRNFEKPQIETSIEVFYKDIRNVSDFKNGSELLKTEHIERSVISGIGRSYGFELMLKKSNGKLNGWINYSYLRSELKFDGTSYEETINNGNFYPSNFDKPNNFNLVVNYKTSKRLSFSSNITYSNGRPGTFPVSKYYIGNDIPVINYSNRNGERIPDYFRIDFSINIEGNLFKKKFAHSYWMISVYNLTGRKNAYSVYYRNENSQISGYKLSVYGVPIITVSYNIKFGNYDSN